jgi:hypothetical protein
MNMVNASRVIALFLVCMLIDNASASCVECFSATKDLEVQQRDLLWRYKGTAATLSGCIAACSGQENPEGCALIACGASCLAIGFDNCVSFFNEAYAIQQYEARIATLCGNCSSAQSAPAPSQGRQECIVADRTDSAVNVRSSPNGRIINRLRNGRKIVITDTVFDYRGRPWVYAEGEYNGEWRKWGLIFKAELDCN